MRLAHKTAAMPPAIARHLLPRDDAFPLRAEALGFRFHSPDEREYWTRDACYALAPEAIAALEAAARECNAMIAAAVDAVVKRGDYGAFGFTDRLAALVDASHRLGEPSLYGRFDFRLSPDGGIKLFEFNAETPAALLEAAVVQLAWFEETPAARLGTDQWNRIDDALVARWPAMDLPRLVHFAAEHEREDEVAQVAYLMATARAAGHEAEFLPVEDISWHEEQARFVTPDGTPLAACFKLYPWDWLDAEEGGHLLPLGRTRWIEPARRMIAANKAILVTLWEMFPGHPLLLPASLDRSAIDGPAIGKPALGLEGHGMRVEGVEEDVSTEIAEGLPSSPTIWQQWAPLPGHATPQGDAYPVMGVWMVGDEPCGLGIREGDELVTTLEDRFVPHVVL
jgi:glutathionylspermidine synthase